MKKIKNILLIIPVIFLVASGCSVKTQKVVTTKEANKNEIAAKSPATEASKMPNVAVPDEKSNSMHSGQLFAKNGSILIYADPESGIYMVDTKTNLSKQLVTGNVVKELYFDGSYVYYMPYYYMGRGIFRVSLEGKAEKICANSSIQLWLTDDKIYFTDQIGFDDINQTPRGNLCTMNKDGSNIKVIVKNVKNYFTIQDQWIYYTDLNSSALYRSKLDGSNRQLLAKGRTLIHNIAWDGYVTYTDYSDSESFHVYNVQTGENTVLGNFGLCCRCNGETYVKTREKDINGIPSLSAWSVLQVDGKTGKSLKRASLDIAKIGIDSMQYVYKDWVYLYSTGYGSSQKAGIYRVKLSLNSFEPEYITGQCLYFLDGYGYYRTEDAPGKPTGFGRINLETREIKTWPFQQK